MKVYDVPWRLREQPQSERLAATKEMRVVVTLDSREYETFRRLRDRIYDPATSEMLLHGDDLAAALNEMHVWMEFRYFAEAHTLSVDERIVKGLEDPSAAQTEAASVMDDMAARGFRIPEDVRQKAREGQLRMDEPGAFGPEPVPSQPKGPRLPGDLSRIADFDGETYVRALDHERLGKQLLAVGRYMADGAWHTLAEISEATGHPEASISARIRDLRKRRFGGHSVNRERLSSGLWRYKLVLVSHEVPWGDDEEERRSA